MLTIRPEQIRAFEEAAWVAFARRVAEAARDRHLGDYTSSDWPDFLTRVTHAIARGRNLGLTTERELARFAFLILRLGPDFESDCRWRGVIRTLEDPALTAVGRLDRAYTAWRRSRRADLPVRGGG